MTSSAARLKTFKSSILFPAGDVTSSASNWRRCATYCSSLAISSEPFGFRASGMDHLYHPSLAAAISDNGLLCRRRAIPLHFCAAPEHLLGWINGYVRASRVLFPETAGL